MKSYSQLRREARFALSGNWGVFALGYLLYVLLVFALTAPVSLLQSAQLLMGKQSPVMEAGGQVWSIIVSLALYPLLWSMFAALLRLLRRQYEREVQLGDFFEGFRRTNSIMWTYLVQTCFSLFGALPFVGGVLLLVKCGVENSSLSEMARPELLMFAGGVALSALGVIVLICVSLRVALTPYVLYDTELVGPSAVVRSWQMMKGQTWRLFVLALTFIPWMLLCVVTLGLAYLWVFPYLNAAVAAFYEDLRGELHSAAVE